MSAAVAAPRTSAALALASALFLGVACGGAPSADEQRSRLARDLIDQTDGALDDTAASCVAAGLYDAFGADSFRVLVRAADDGADPDVRTRVIGIFGDCDAIAPIIEPRS